MRSCIVFETLLLLHFTRSIHGFANYLLTKGGCWTELSPEEAIMGASVLSVDQQEESYGFALRVMDHTSDTASIAHEAIVAIDESELPKTLMLQLLAEKPLPAQLRDYQWVMDVVSEEEDENSSKEPSASFVNGGCDDNKRISGKEDGRVELSIRSLPVTLTAGWAAGHEAVKLVPKLTFISQSHVENASEGGLSEKKASNSRKEEVEPAGHAVQHETQKEDTDWTRLLLSPEGCHRGSLEDTRIKSFLHESDIQIIEEQEAENFALALDKIDGSAPAIAVLTFGADTFKHISPSYCLLLEASSGASFEGGSCDQRQRVMINRSKDDLQQPWPRLLIPQATEPITVTGLLHLHDSSTSPLLLRRTKPLTIEWHMDPQKHIDRKSRVEDMLQQQLQLHRQDVKDEKNLQMLEEPPRKIYDRHRGHGASERRASKNRTDRHGFEGGKSWYMGMLILLAAPFCLLPLCLHLSTQSRRKGRLNKVN